MAPADISGSYFMGAFNGGINFGAAALVRVHAVGMGVEGTAGGALFDYGYAMLAGDTGFSWVTESGFRLDVLGALGANHYSGAGRGFMSSDPGASATLPSAGARVIAGYMFLKGTAHLELAARGFFDDDLTRRTVSYDYTETGGWFGAPPYAASVTHRVGTWRAGAALDLICTWDL